MERKGICKNVGVCSKANKIQVITDDDADFVCPECGEELQEVKDEPVVEKKKSPLPMIIGGVALLCAIGAGCFFAFSGGETEEPTPVVDSIATDSVVSSEPVVKTDTVVVRDTIVKNNTTTISEKTSTKTVVTSTEKKSSQSANGTVNLGYAKFIGPLKSGKPNGQGRMTFASSHQIDSRDPKGRVADAGDYVIGEWNNGNLIQGRWYGSDGNVKGSIIIGM